MYTAIVKSRKQLERASLRAQAQKPRISEQEFGHYSVYSTNPATPLKSYDTGIQRLDDGTYEVICFCPTQPRLDRKTGEMKDCFCKHAASVFPHFLMREKQQAALVAAQAQVKTLTAARGPGAPWTR